MITKADLDQPWMMTSQRIAAAALAEVGVRMTQPPPGSHFLTRGQYPSSTPLDVVYRAASLALMGTGRPMLTPDIWLSHVRTVNHRSVTPTDAERASMQRFYDLHAR